jgi:hypothetical protein
MAAIGTVNNKDGLVVQMSGDYQKWNSPYVNRLRSVNTTGPMKWYVMDFDLETVGASATYFPHDLNNDGTRDGFHVGEAYLPQGSCIVRAFVVTSEVAAGGTDFTVGTYTVAGATTDADGIVNATNGAIANMGTVGEIIIASGDLVGDASGTVGITADSYVAVTTNGTFTAGKGRLYIEVAN